MDGGVLRLSLGVASEKLPATVPVKLFRSRRPLLCERPEVNDAP